MATLIYDVNDLQDMNLDLAADYELANDIDASGFAFVPLGTFTGTLDLKGHVITDLTISGTHYTCFINTNSGTIKNGEFATLVISGIYNSTTVVALVRINLGTIQDIEITDCQITGVSTALNVYGAPLVYNNNGGTIENCHATGSITGTGNTTISAWTAIAGLVVYNNGLITGCSSTVSVTGTSQAHTSAGGLVSINGVLVTGTIIQSYATGNVIATSTYGGAATRYAQAGGFVSANGYTGPVTGIINNCYDRGNVTAIATGTALAYAGGFVYRNESGSITDAYSTGVPTGAHGIGGFCQSNNDTITDCFWDTQTSGTAVSDGGTGKTTAQMKTKTTFSGWDFSSIWSITTYCNNGYPCLLNTTPNCALIPSIQGPQVREIIALEAMRNIEMSCMGRVYVDEEGNLTYESRYARNP